MHRSLLSCAALAVLGFASFARQAAAVEVIEIRTGQSATLPGTCGQADDSFRMLTGPCGAPLVTAAFGPTEFNAAQAGAFATVIDPYGNFWVPGLACDPKARWISSGPLYCGYPGGGLDNTILYAVPFTVQTPNNPRCALEVCWAVDDGLGDQPWSTYNPDGVYVNGTPVAISAGAYNPQTIASQNINVLTGSNWIYFYQRDAGCAVAGLILSAKITCDLPVADAPLGWSNVKALYR